MILFFLFARNVVIIVWCSRSHLIVERGVSLYQDLAKRFHDLLKLKQSPIGLAFVDNVPVEVQQTDARVPSACTFWRLAEQGVFYAAAEDHQECPIGMMTMGFTMPEASQQRAQALVQTMADMNWLHLCHVGR